MQKKVLIPVLMAVPAAIPAMADVDMGFPVDNWTQGGTTGQENKFDPGTKTFNCVVGTGYLQQTLSLPKGKYKLVFSAQNNVKVVVGTDEIIPTAVGTEGIWYAEFELTGEETTIKITGENPEEGFSFTGKELLLVFDQNAAANEIQTQLNQLQSETLLEVATEDDFEQANERRTELTEINEALTYYNGVTFVDVLSEIRSIGGTASSEEAIKIYEKYGLDRNPTLIDEYLTPLGKRITDYNEAVKAENAAWQVYLGNKAALEGLLAEQDELAINIGKVKKAIEEWTVVDKGIKDDINAKADTLATNIEDYKTEIKTAYPIDTNRERLRSEITFESKSKKDALQAEITDLQKELDTLKANYDTYYRVNYLSITKLTEAWNNYKDAVNAALGIMGYETVYESLKDTKTKDADVYYNDIKAKNTIPDVEGANDYNTKNKCEENINAAIKKFEDGTKEYKWLDGIKGFKKMVEDQNSNMTTALGQIGEFNATVDKFEDPKFVVPEQFKTEFKEKLNAIKAAVENLRQYVNTEYNAHTLDVTGTSEYGTQVAEINSLIEDMNDFTQPFQVINDLAGLLKDKKAEIKGISDDTAGKVENKVDIYSKFEGNFTAFEEAIKNLDATSANDPAIVEEIKKQIDLCVTNAQAMSDYFIKAYNTINGYQTLLDKLVKFVDAKLIDSVEAVHNLKEAFYTKYTKEGGQFAKAIADLWDLYTAAATGDPNGAYDDIKKLYEETLAKPTLIAAMDAAKAQFAKDATAANYTYAEGEVGKLVTAWEAAKTAGITNAGNVKVAEVEQKLGVIKTDISAAEMSTDPTGEFAVCDEDIVTLLAQVVELNQKIEDLTANQDKYTALVDQMNKLQTLLDQVSEYNEANSLDPGKSYYKDTVIPAIQKKINKLNADLPVSLENGTVVADSEGENGYDAQVAALEKEISNTGLAIENNNKAHNDQLAREKTVRKYIEDLIAVIDGNDNAENLPDVKTWLSTLQGLIDNDLNKVNIDVTGSYGKGKSVEDNQAIMDAYQAIYDKANEIDKMYHGDAFNKAVVEANTDTTAGWKSLIEGLWNQYKEGIGTYNIFYYDLKNEGWKAAVIAAVERHASLFGFYEKITTLTEEETKAVDEWNKNNHVITAKEWKVWTDKAEEVSAAITADVDGLLAEADAAAEAYYGYLGTKAADAINEAEISLNNAGISLDNLDEARSYYDHAVALYGGATEHVSFFMDEIADNLDKVFVSIHLQQYAEEAWGVEYGKAQNVIDVLREEINGYQHAQPEVKEAALQGFNETVENIVALNAEVTAVKEGLIDRYKTDVESLEELLNVLRSYRDEVKKSNDLNVEDQELQDNFDNVWLPGMNDAYEALREYCETLGGCASMEAMLGQIRNEIDAISGLVANYGGRLVELNLEQRFNLVMTGINDAYETAYNYEVTYLRQLLKDTKVAFNDAVKYNDEGIDFDAVDGEIEALNAKIQGLGNRYSEAEKDALHDELLGYEKELCELYVMLQSSWGDKQNPATTILNGLNGRYDTIAQAIASGEELLGVCMDSVKGEFAGKYGELKTALDAEKNDWSDDGDHIVARETYYTNALNEIEAKVNALTEDVKVAEEAAQAEAEKQRVSNERYDVLKTELEALNQQFVDAKAIVEDYGEDIAALYSARANYIEKELGKMSEKLEADKAGYLLTADSELEGAAKVERDINEYKFDATGHYAYYVALAATREAGADAANKLAKLDIVPAQRKVLEDRYNEANDEYQALRSEYIEVRDEVNNANFGRLREIITRAGELTEIFKSISEEAVASSFVKGDVDLSGTEPDVLDVQMLINMVGEGMAYQDLYAENARQACAADVTGNEKLNVADVTALIQIILGDDFNVVKVNSRKVVAKAEGGISLTLAEEGDGVRRYALALNGGVPFTGGQLDIHTSGNAKVTAVATSARTEAHDAYLFDRGLGDFRVVLASMENAVFEGNDGVIVYIDVEGDGELTVSNALFSDTNNIEHEMGRAHTSAVDAVIDYCKDGVKKIYDAAGRAYNSLQRGINIIVNKDGSVKKELRK